MSAQKLAAALLAVGMGLAACGGGGGSGSEGGSLSSSGGGIGSGGSAGPAPSGSGGTPPTADSPATDNPAQEEFEAAAIAPAEGTMLSGSVRIEVEGEGIENAELLPAAGGRPYAIFTVDPDKSRAWVEFDTRTVANGQVSVVIDAYDQPPRTEGAQAIRAMQPRSWVIQNDQISSPYPGDYPLRRDAEPLQAMVDMSDEEFARMIDTEWPRVHALLQEYIPDNVVFMPPVPLGFEGPRSTCIQNAYGAPAACREYMIRILMLL